MFHNPMMCSTKKEVVVEQDPNTLLLLHFDGADESTTFTDSSKYGKTITASGTPKITNINPKFDGALKGDATGGLNVLGGEFNFGAGDFTIECWVKIPVGDAPVSYLIHKRAGFSVANTTFGISYNQTGNFSCSFLNASNTSIGALNFVVNPALFGTWMHVAYVRNGSAWTAYFNGAAAATATSADAIKSTAHNLTIGHGQGVQYTALSIDELKISNVARYTTDFTPPPAPFSNIYELSGFTPADISTVVAWYDAQDESTITLSGANVTGWADKANANDMTVEFVAPTYVEADAIAKGLPSIGARVDNLNQSGLRAVTPMTLTHIYMVVYYKTGVETLFSQHSSIVSSTGNYLGQYRINGLLNSSGFISSDAFGNGAVVKNGTPSPSTILPLPLSVCKFVHPSPITQSYRFGFNAVDAGRGWVGAYSEIICLNGAPTGEEEWALMKYLYDKWSITP